ncbi:MAG: hypothetical protein JWO18_3095 [Microbacteriaceae bacterium]|jgi:hypothetical protein|nr:hypothetical protein [Microbacteriaceae bacterium]
MTSTATPARRVHRRLAITALVLAVVGAAVGYWGFVSGIDYALNGSGGGPGPSIIVFFVGAALSVAAVVVAIVGLMRSSRKTLPTIALVIGLLPIGALIVTALANRR